MPAPARRGEGGAAVAAVSRGEERKRGLPAPPSVSARQRVREECGPRRVVSPGLIAPAAQGRPPSWLGPGGSGLQAEGPPPPPVPVPGLCRVAQAQACGLDGGGEEAVAASGEPELCEAGKERAGKLGKTSLLSPRLQLDE